MLNLMGKVENVKDVMWRKSESFCLETEVPGSELPVSISKQRQSDQLVGIEDGSCFRCTGRDDL